MNTITIPVSPRSEVGSKSARDLRKAGRIPCVLYGGNEVLHFSTTPNEVRHLIYTPDFQLAELDVDGTKHRAIIKSIQFHPVTEVIEHIDFQELVDGHPIRVQLPVSFVGVSPGVKNGGKLMKLLRRVKVKMNPEDMIDKLVLDISKLKLGGSIRVRDIQLNEGVEIMSDPGTPVASVVVPRALKSMDGLGEEEEGAEGEGEEAAAEEASE
jgi:large subunit ribosomal protein L25